MSQIVRNGLTALKPAGRTPSIAISIPYKIRAARSVRSLSKSFVFSLLLAAALLQLACWLLRGFDPMASREHGPLENFQVACLALGAVIFLREAAQSAGGPVRILALGLALLHCSLLILELDVRSLGVPAWVNSLMNGTIRDAWLGLLWLAWGGAAWKGRRAVLRTGESWMASRSGLVMIYAGIFWILGGIIEKGRLFSRADLTLYAEEAMEVCAAFFMLVAAFLFKKWRSGLPIAFQSFLAGSKSVPENAGSGLPSSLPAPGKPGIWASGRARYCFPRSELRTGEAWAGMDAPRPLGVS